MRESKLGLEKYWIYSRILLVYNVLVCSCELISKSQSLGILGDNSAIIWTQPSICGSSQGVVIKVTQCLEQEIVHLHFYHVSDRLTVYAY